MEERAETDWVSRFADEVIALAEARNPGGTIVCASGLSPSGPVHLGNLREVMTPHLVADEIRRRGYPCEHVLSWDDFDRFRKVPAGVDPSWSEHIGKPLTAVPAPPGSPYPNWAEHFKAPMVEALETLGVQYRGISQTQMYRSGAYVEQVLLAMRERAVIDGILGRYRTKITATASAGENAPAGPDAEGVELVEAEQAEGSGAAGDEDGSSSSGYYPYKPYCSICGTDFTTVTSYDDASTELSYRCDQCGHTETVLLSEHRGGKLVWKVDWPMRWAFENVAFEPSGVDHSSPGSSFVVGQQIVRRVFEHEPPLGPMYAFVGISGMAKMSSSKGAVPTPSDALQILEAPLLRWLYARRRPNQSFKVAFDQEIHRLYDEWDALGRKVADGSAAGSDLSAYHRAIETMAAKLPLTPHPVPYRTLVSIVDIATGDDEQVLRILRQLDPESSGAALAEYEPRLECAKTWAATQLPPEQRTRIREQPDEKLLADLGDDESRMLAILLEKLGEDWSLTGLTTLVYGVPKIFMGLPLEVKPTPELKAAQRQFFILLYRLLVGGETGPRLPTLLLATGEARARALLTAPAR